LQLFVGEAVGGGFRGQLVAEVEELRVGLAAEAVVVAGGETRTATSGGSRSMTTGSRWAASRRVVRLGRYGLRR
jgi:hypothetical protein